MSDETDRLLEALNHQIAENEMLAEAWQSEKAENQRLRKLLMRWWDNPDTIESQQQLEDDTGNTLWPGVLRKRGGR